MDHKIKNTYFTLVERIGVLQTLMFLRLYEVEQWPNLTYSDWKAFAPQNPDFASKYLFDSVCEQDWPLFISTPDNPTLAYLENAGIIFDEKSLCEAVRLHIDTDGFRNYFRLFFESKLTSIANDNAATSIDPHFEHLIETYGAVNVLDFFAASFKRNNEYSLQTLTCPGVIPDYLNGVKTPLLFQLMRDDNDACKRLEEAVLNIKTIGIYVNKKYLLDSIVQRTTKSYFWKYVKSTIRSTLTNPQTVS